MTNRLKYITKTTGKLIPVLKENNVTKAGIFGSFSRGDFKKNSDVDILVEIKKNISLLDFVDLKLKLESKIGRKVDLVEYGAIKPLLRKRILSEETRII